MEAGEGGERGDGHLRQQQHQREEQEWLRVPRPGATHALQSRLVKSSIFFRSRSASPIVQTRECANGPGVTRGVKTCQSSANTLQVSVP